VRELRENASIDLRYDAASHYKAEERMICHHSSVIAHVCMYVCLRKFIMREFLQPKQSRVCASRPC